MDYLRRLTIVTIATFFLFSSAFYCVAAYPGTWLSVRSTVFRYAQEQDKYILLFVGISGCDFCITTHGQFTDPESPVKKILDDNYIIWYSDDKNPQRLAENLVYSTEVRKKSNIYYPLLFIINPEVPDVSIDSSWTPSNTKLYARVDGDLVANIPEFNDFFINFLSFDLLSGSSLKWYKNKEEVFNLAKQQNKYVFKLEGRGGSNVCRQVIKQLDSNTLKKLLQDNYILWYDEFDPDVHPGVKAPAISVIYPYAPDIILDSTGGYQEVEVLESLLKSHTVSNETVASGNQVTVLGNVIQVSNQVKNEQIRIFSLTGQQLAFVRKIDDTVTIDASHFPKGVVIVAGSSGWSTKILAK